MTLLPNRRTTKTTPDPVKQYALDVTSGKEIAGPLVRQAGERHLRDLVDGKKRGLRWELAAAERVFGYFHEVLRLVNDAGRVVPFKLHPSQQFIVGSLFGWKGPDGYRRYRVAYIEQGKGNGKSPLVGAIGLYMLTGDGEVQAQVFSAAVDRDQAKVPFHFAVSMVDRSELLSGAITKSGGKFGDVTKVHNLFHRKSGSYFRALSSDNAGRGKSGFLPHCVILDELHEHPTDAMVEFVRANTKGRKQPLVLMITNSGVYDPTSVCWRYHNYAERLMTGTGEVDDEFFAYVCSLDKGDCWTDRAVWKKGNPLLGVSIPERYLEQQVREATGMPSKQSVVRRLNFCEWVESAAPFVEPEVWTANGATVNVEELRGRSCSGGLDLSGKNDLTALCLVFKLDNGTKPVLSFFWTPKDTLREREDRDRAPYQQWVREGHLIAKEGRTIDYRWVAKKIGELTSLYRIESIAFDRWRIDDLQRELDAEGVDVTLIPHGQGFQDMNPAVESLEDDLLESRLQHGNHPVLTWCVANVRVTEDPAGNRKFDKRKATGRIDGCVALAMADNLSLVRNPEPSYQMIFL
jgi:phage terminase large subunit-like protein